ASKEQEKRKLDSMIDNLISMLAELPKASRSKAVMANIAKYEKQRDQIAASLSQLRLERRQKAKVIDVKQVFKLFGMFKKNFTTRPAHEQRAMLRDIVRKVIVTRDGLRVLYYSGPKEEESIEISPSAIEER